MNNWISASGNVGLHEYSEALLFISMIVIFCATSPAILLFKNVIDADNYLSIIFNPYMYYSLIITIIGSIPVSLIKSTYHIEYLSY